MRLGSGRITTQTTRSRTGIRSDVKQGAEAAGHGRDRRRSRRERRRCRRRTEPVEPAQPEASPARCRGLRRPAEQARSEHGGSDPEAAPDIGIELAIRRGREGPSASAISGDHRSIADSSGQKLGDCLRARSCTPRRPPNWIAAKGRCAQVFPQPSFAARTDWSIQPASVSTRQHPGAAGHKPLG
jgi:hypothetical protein